MRLEKERKQKRDDWGKLVIYAGRVLLALVLALDGMNVGLFGLGGFIGTTCPEEPAAYKAFERTKVKVKFHGSDFRRLPSCSMLDDLIPGTRWKL